MAAAMILLFGTAIGTTAVNYAKAADYNEQISLINEEASRISEESSEIAETLKEENHDEYFEKVASLADLKNIDIVAHFDVIAKITENGYYLDRNDKTFLSYGYEAISALKGKVPIFELNVGAIARKRALCAYPNEHFIREFKNQGFGAVITTDCHNKEDLDGGMSLAKDMLLSCGYKEIYVLKNGSFEPIPIED